MVIAIDPYLKIKWSLFVNIIARMNGDMVPCIGCGRTNLGCECELGCEGGRGE